MSYIETPEDIAKQLHDARQQLRDFEENMSAKVLIARLHESSPWHPALLARRIFGALAIITGLGAIAVVSLPFVAPDLATSLRSIENAINLPLPVAFGITAASLFVAWLMATLAAISIGKECELLPDEAVEHQRLSEQAARLARQKAVLERIRGTPMGAQPRTGTPGFSTPRRSAALAERGLVPDSGSAASEPPLIRQSLYEPQGNDPLPSPRSPASTSGSGSLLSRREVPPATPAFLGAATRGGTPLGAAPRGGTPVGSTPGRTATPTPSPLREGPPSLSYGAPTDEYAQPDASERSYGGAYGGGEHSHGGEPGHEEYAQPESDPAYADQSYGGMPAYQDPSERSYGGYAEPESSHPGGNYFDDDIPTQPGLAPAGAIEIPDIVDTTSTAYSGGGFASASSTAIPRWGPVDEPWLEDAIEKAEILAETFPIQAHLEFSVEAHLPFTLVLKRATPAMAVRAMVSYVEFLASIHTPPRARVVLQSVPHLDRSFHRNVMAALEPYFPDTAEVIAGQGLVDITFTQPDPGWQHHPYLPLAE